MGNRAQLAAVVQTGVNKRGRK